MGKQKIKIEKIENKHQRQICFSKRRMGLFKKAADLATMGCQIAVIVFSDFGNIFTFGHTDVDEIARCYVDEAVPVFPYHENDPGSNHAEGSGHDQEVAQLDGEDVVLKLGLIDDNYDDDDDEDDYHEEVTMSDEIMFDDDNGEAAPTSKEVVAVASKEEIQRDRRFWWNRPMDSMELEELEELPRTLSELRRMAKKRENQLLEEEPLSLCSWAKYLQ